tara:strand:+ start:1619 stop:3058 length:1440 start_codon:yes stop_codon:yes gene_type:complete
MSIQKQRNSLISSSNSINSIRDSVSNFSKGLGRTSSLASGIIDQTRKTNIFTSKLIRKDDEYFNKRRENVRRKQREDELESTSIKGVEKKQGNIIQRSTKGFLGRILDFFGIILIGWFINTLPKILNAISAVTKRIKQLTAFLTNFVEGIGDFFISMSQGIRQAMDSLPKFDFLKLKKEQTDENEKAVGALTLLNDEFSEAVQDFNRSVDTEVYTKDVNKNNLEMTYGEDIDKAYKDGIDKAKEEGQIEEETEGVGDVGDATLGIGQIPNESSDNLISAVPSNENVDDMIIEDEGQNEDDLVVAQADKIIDDGVKLVNEQKENDASSEKDADAEIKENKEKLKTTIGNVSNNNIMKRKNKNKKIVSPLLAKRFKEKTAKQPITFNGVTLNPGDEGYDDAINFIGRVGKESGAIVPITKDEKNLVKNRKSNKTTVIIQEVAVNTGGGGSSGGVGGDSSMPINFAVNKDPIRKAQTLILNS